MPKPWELYTPQETSTPPWEKFSEEKTKPWDSFKESFGSAKKTLGSMIGKVRKPIDLLADTSTELATTGGLDFSNQQPADLQNQPSLIPFKEQGQITPEEQKIQSEVNLDVDLFQLADNIATVGFDSKDEAMKVKKRQDFIMSRAPLIASGMASPIAVMGFEIFNQLKGLSVSSNTGQKYDPLQTKQLTDLLPDDTPQPLRLGLSVGEMVGDVALLGTLLNMANKGILDSTLKEVESKMTNRGYSKEDVKSVSEVLKNVVKGSTEKNIKASFGVEKWEPMVQVKPSPKLPGVKGVVKGGVKGTEIVKPKSIPEITPKIPKSAVMLPKSGKEIYQPTPTTPPDAQKLGVVSEVPPKVEIPQGEVKPVETPKSSPLVEEARKYKSAEEWVSTYRGSATQYSGYNPNIRKFGTTEGSERISDLGVDPELDVTIYRGVSDGNKKLINAKIVDGDFVTTDSMSAESYAGKNNVVSMKVKAKDLIHDFPDEFDSNKPFGVGAEFIYSDNKNKLIKYTDKQLTEIWNKANKVDETSVKQTIEKSGGQFIGIQEGFDDVKSMAMFNDPKTGSTLSLPIDGVTSEAVSEKLGKTEKVFKEKKVFGKADKKFTEESGVVANPLEVTQKTKEYVNKNWTTLREKIEDDWIRVKKLTQKEGVKLTEANNPYEAETRYWGRVGTRMEDTLDQISDIDKEIAKVEKKYKSPEINKDIDRYLIAKHAPERNVVHGEESAGITSEQASKNIKEIEGKSYGKEVKQIAKDIKKLNEKTLDVLLEGEVISQGDYDKLRKLYPNHIPLNRVMSESEDFVQILTSRGFNVQGTGIKRAFGSKKEVADILGNVTANLRSAIARSEKNIVDNHTLNFARDNDYFDGLFEEIKPKTIGKTFEGGFIQEHINDPSVLPVREKGKQVYLKINDPQIAVAFRGVNRIKVDDLTRMVAAFTRFYAGLMTRFNPEFAVPNKVRDLQETMVYMASKKDIGFSGAAKTAIKDPVSIKAVVDYMGGKDTEGARLYQQMKEDGGTTGGLGLSTKKQTEIDIDKIRRINRNKPRKVAEIALRVVDNWNAIFEDSTRLSVYRQSLSQGLSRKKSAVYAKEASINFNKMGALSPMTNGIWMFSNASVQGSAKMLRAMRDPKVAGMVLATIGGSIYAINEYNDKIDPEWRSKVSEWDRLNGITIMLPSNKGVRYITIPVSWGLKPIKVGMDYFIDYTQGHEKDIKTAMSKVLAAIWEGYNPVGGTDIVSAVTPTILDLRIDISRNRSWTGGKIRPNWNQSAPDSIKYFDSLKDKLMGKKFIGWTRKLGEKGIEISPADMNYAFQQLVGGTGRFTQKVFETISGVKKGKIEAKEIPFISRFYRDIPEDRIRGESKEFESLKDALKKQDKERFYFNQEAELVYEGMKQIPAKEANENYNKMEENNPRLAKKIKHLRENEKYKLTYIERLTKQLGDTNGERFKYIWSKVSELKTGKEKNTYLKDLIKKKIISDNVWEQLVSMSKKKGKKTLGSKIGKDLLNENK